MFSASASIAQEGSKFLDSKDFGVIKDFEEFSKTKTAKLAELGGHNIPGNNSLATRKHSYRQGDDEIYFR